MKYREAAERSEIFVYEPEVYASTLIDWVSTLG